MFDKTIARRWWLSFALTLVLAGSVVSNAQVTPTAPGANPNPLPREDYYRVLGDYYSGEYGSALKDFTSLTRSGYSDIDGKFLDSVCYLTMQGECFYKRGDYASAVTSYEAAIEIYVLRSIWEPRTRIPATISPRNNAITQARVNWFQTARQTEIGSFPRNYSYMFGRMDNERVLQEGGVVQNPTARPVDMTEALRCTALALYRRRELRGLTCKYDPFSREIVQALTTQQLDATNPVGAWKSVLAGLAYSGVEDWEKARVHLRGAVQIGGRFDHPLTPIALVELGNLAAIAGKMDVAQNTFLEASHCAAVFQQYDLVEHSLRHASKAYQLTQPNDIYAPLQPAIAWANREKARFMQSSLIVELAYNLADVGDSESALQMIGTTRRPMARTDISATTVNPRIWYVMALAKFQLGQKNARRDLDRFVKENQAGSKWIYQLRLADAMIASGQVPGSDADALYSRLLRQPSLADWIGQPDETLTFLLTPHSGPLERWFEILLIQRKIDKAVYVGELLKQHRFYSNLPLGGRLLAFRWLLESPEINLPPESLDLRKKLLARFPVYQELSTRSAELQKQIRQRPLIAEPDTDESRELQKLYAELAKTSAAQEYWLSAMALMRIETTFEFLSAAPLREQQKSLGPRQAVIYCVATSNHLHVLLVGKETHAIIASEKNTVARAMVAKLLKQIGSSKRGAAVSVERLLSDGWKEPAQALRTTLLPKRDKNFWKNFEEVIVVPDGVTWYLPWELLQVTAGDTTENFGDIVGLRMMPTLGMGTRNDKTPRQIDRAAVVVGQMSSKDDKSVAESAFVSIHQANPLSMSITSRPRIPSSLLATSIDQLIVLSESKQPLGFGFSPMVIDSQQRGGSLAHWFELPLAQPQVMIMPGVNTAAADGVRGKADGQDLFMTTCCLMAGGARTILISRWNVGGSTPVSLARDFATTLDESTATEAWDRAKSLTQRAELSHETEPRIKISSADESVSASHPFFWSGYLLIDVNPRPSSKE